jgi:hypothetical protein
MDEMYSILANYILKLDVLISKQKMFYKLYEQTRQHH